MKEITIILYSSICYLDVCIENLFCSCCFVSTVHMMVRWVAHESIQVTENSTCWDKQWPRCTGLKRFNSKNLGGVNQTPGMMTKKTTNSVLCRKLLIQTKAFQLLPVTFLRCTQNKAIGELKRASSYKWWSA